MMRSNNELPEEIKQLLIDKPAQSKPTELEKRTILLLKILKDWKHQEITIDDIIKEFWFQFEYRFETRVQISCLINQPHITDIFGNVRKKQNYTRDGVELCGYCYQINQTILQKLIEERLPNVDEETNSTRGKKATKK